MLLAAEPFEKNDFSQAGITPLFFNIIIQKNYQL